MLYFAFTTLLPPLIFRAFCFLSFFFYFTLFFFSALTWLYFRVLSLFFFISAYHVYTGMLVLLFLLTFSIYFSLFRWILSLSPSPLCFPLCFVFASALHVLSHYLRNDLITHSYVTLTVMYVDTIYICAAHNHTF